jgi:2-keto-4-pentenoate hydratase/2-oxohepta-3-ene-1,7-dioic acid hydratase (catechol pathway)
VHLEAFFPGLLGVIAGGEGGPLAAGAAPDVHDPFRRLGGADTILQVADGAVAELPYPSMTTDYHHEVEMVVALSLGGRDIPVEQALSHVFGYAVGLDMTRRDLQLKAKAQSHPWELAKCADFSSPIGPIHLAEEVGHLTSGSISLSVDGVPKQSGKLSDMIWSVAEQISYLSKYFELRPGDLIYSGTPEGVGPVERGQKITARIDNLGEINLLVV